MIENTYFLMIKREIKFKDNRKKEIVFLSSCILNQNNRYPGIAVCEGAVSALIEPFLKKGAGIEQLPCLECMGWGGVSRNTIFKFFPIVFKRSNSRFIKLFSKIWLWNFKRLCKKEASKLVNRVQNYLNSSYKILGVIAMNDSPTCGATKTLDLLDTIFRHKELDISLDTLQFPRIEEMKELLDKIVVKGQGLFMRELISKLRKKKINLKIVGFDPWLDVNEESERIVNLIFEEWKK